MLNKQTTTQRDKELCSGKKCCENFWFGGYVRSAEENVYMEKNGVCVSLCVIVEISGIKNECQL